MSKRTSRKRKYGHLIGTGQITSYFSKPSDCNCDPNQQCLQSKFFYSNAEINRIGKENEMFICPKCTLDELVTGKTDDKKK